MEKIYFLTLLYITVKLTEDVRGLQLKVNESISKIALRTLRTRTGKQQVAFGIERISKG